MMPRYSRKTILSATDLLEDREHDAIDRFVLEHDALEGYVGPGTTRDRANSIARFLLQYTEVEEDSKNLTDIIIEELVGEAVRNCTKYGQFDYGKFSERYAKLNRSLQRDGYTVEDGELRKSLPEALNLPQADDEVHVLLKRYGFDIPLGHLDNAISAHGRSEWAGANGQLRTFVEALFDAIAQALAARLGQAAPEAGYASQQWLHKLNPSFFEVGLNEWTDQGTGFVNGFWKRLHPEGAHPGLSDDEDSTLRLHLVLLVTRSLLLRFDGRMR